jgi:GH15 family glucan-1,4-alpha-glucosidase
MHKYQPDRAIGSTWHPLVHDDGSGGRRRELAIQEDETAIVIFMIGEFYRRSQDKTFMLGLYDSFVSQAANFMAGFIDEATGLPHASYDLWEQKFLTSTYTVSTVIAGLETAAMLADEANHPDDAVRWRQAAARIRSSLHLLYRPAADGQGGYFCKGFLLQEDGSLQYDDSLDISSLYGAFMFSGLHHDDPMISSTLAQVEARLLDSSPIGGVIRFEHDDYFLAKRQFKGNPWIVCTLWLSQVYMALGRETEAQRLLAWSRDRAGASGVLSEQFDPEDGHQLGVTPLVWSHAELINTVLDVAPHKD